MVFLTDMDKTRPNYNQKQHKNLNNQTRKRLTNALHNDLSLGLQSFHTICKNKWSSLQLPGSAMGCQNHSLTTKIRPVQDCQSTPCKRQNSFVKGGTP